MLTRQDFRLRRVPGGYRVSQLVTRNGWELLTDVYPSKQDAAAFIAQVVAGGVK